VLSFPATDSFFFGDSVAVFFNFFGDACTLEPLLLEEDELEEDDEELEDDELEDEEVTEELSESLSSSFRLRFLEAPISTDKI
jgi:hypothetical protein